MYWPRPVRSRWKSADEIAKTPFGRGEQANIEGLVAWIAAESRGLKFNLPQGNPEERKMLELGKRAFFFRAGPYDFSCASCHGMNGIATAARVPHIAGQRAAYVHLELRAYQGGGRPDMAQAGGPDGAKADAALSAIEKAMAGA